MVRTKDVALAIATDALAQRSAVVTTIIDKAIDAQFTEEGDVVTVTVPLDEVALRDRVETLYLDAGWDVVITDLGGGDWQVQLA